MICRTFRLSPYREASDGAERRTGQPFGRGPARPFQGVRSTTGPTHNRTGWCVLPWTPPKITAQLQRGLTTPCHPASSNANSRACANMYNVGCGRPPQVVIKSGFGRCMLDRWQARDACTSQDMRLADGRATVPSIGPLSCEIPPVEGTCRAGAANMLSIIGLSLFTPERREARRPARTNAKGPRLESDASPEGSEGACGIGRVSQRG